MQDKIEKKDETNQTTDHVKLRDSLLTQKSQIEAEILVFEQTRRVILNNYIGAVKKISLGRDMSRFAERIKENPHLFLEEADQFINLLKGRIKDLNEIKKYLEQYKIHREIYAIAIAVIGDEAKDPEVRLQSIDRMPELNDGYSESSGLNALLELIGEKNSINDWKALRHAYSPDILSTTIAGAGKIANNFINNFVSFVQNTDVEPAEQIPVNPREMLKKQLEAKLVTLKNAITNIDKKLTTSQAEGEDIIRPYDKFNKAIESINKQKLEYEQLNKMIEEKNNQLSVSQKELKETSLKIYNLTVHEINKAQQQLNALAEGFKNRPYTDNQTTYQENQTWLEETTKELCNVPDELYLENFARHVTEPLEKTRVSDEIKKFMTNTKEFIKKYQQHEDLNNALAQRLKKKEQLVDELIVELTAHHVAKARKTPAKDAGDAKSGDTIADTVVNNANDVTNPVTPAPVNELYPFVAALNTYKADGNGQPVLEMIRKQRIIIQDEKLQLLLNKLTVFIIDSQRKAKAAMDVEPVDQHQKAQELLNTLTEQRHQGHVAAAKALYEQIEGIRQHGKAIGGSANDATLALADGLQADLDEYLLNSDNNPLKAGYDAFGEIFTARVKSHSEEMGQHRALWKVIVGNLLAGLATLGMAFVVNYAVTGNFFFFTETKRQQHVHAIQRSFKNMETLMDAPVDTPAVTLVETPKL